MFVFTLILLFILKFHYDLVSLIMVCLIDCMYEAVRTYSAINQYPIYLSIFYTIQFHYDLVSLIMVDHNFKGRSQVRLEKRR